MKTPLISTTAFALMVSMAATTALAEDIRIVSWNASPNFAEALSNRLSDFSDLDADLQPDILILVETGGDLEVRMIAEQLGWEDFTAVTSNWAIADKNVFFSLEAAVISRIPIVQVVEYDASPDGHHEVFGPEGDIPGLVSEEILTADGIVGFGDTLAKTDRGTMRVDLENGLSIFPLHLKSNRNSACSDLSTALRTMNRLGFTIDPNATMAPDAGFEGATLAHLSNAAKRERVMAATARIAASVVQDGRVPVIAGDMNTSFEPGKAGTAVEDCELQEFTCDRAPFPASACTGADGFDDTLGMLTAGLIAEQIWTVLTEGLGRTYDSTDFSDLAIDHFAVPVEVSDSFSTATKADRVYGSDHFPIITVYSE
ncbi:hypothetical protein [uncultured Litoreibacter sp.]|uniref:hypothetical protein n=1 Tax=uncultured Litoreibacter sp. TaxID=1392394 RepID=UPI00261B5B59|nr:hypothetical protein [uncultured Litoreibacter sp.]